MKRNAEEHPKFLETAALLDIDEAFASGIINNMWAFAQKYAPRGDIGRFSDAAIVRGIKTRLDPGRVIGVLVQVRLLDACPCHRLRIHNWNKHADQTVQRKEEVKRAGFLECYNTLPSNSLQTASRKLAEDEQSASSELACRGRAMPLTDNPPPPAGAGGDIAAPAELPQTPAPEGPPPKPPGLKPPKPKAAAMRSPPSPMAHRRSLNGNGSARSPEETKTLERKAAQIHVLNMAEQARVYAISVGQHPTREHIRTFKGWARAGHPLVEIQAAIDRLDHIRKRQLRL